jgi:hypothetical protein
MIKLFLANVIRRFNEWRKTPTDFKVEMSQVNREYQ